MVDYMLPEEQAQAGAKAMHVAGQSADAVAWHILKGQSA